MNDRAESIHAEVLSGLNPELANAAQWIIDQLQQGTAVTATYIKTTFPTLATQLLELLPAIESLCSLSAMTDSPDLGGVIRVLIMSTASNVQASDHRVCQSDHACQAHWR